MDSKPILTACQQEYKDRTESTSMGMMDIVITKCDSDGNFPRKVYTHPFINGAWCRDSITGKTTEMVPLNQKNALSCARKRSNEEFDLDAEEFTLESGEFNLKVEEFIPNLETDMKLDEINKYRSFAQNLNPGNTIILPDRTFHRTQQFVVEHKTGIFSAICSIKGEHKMKNHYGKIVQSYYKKFCLQNAPWNINPCDSKTNISQLEKYSRNYYICGVLRKRFNDICIIKGDIGHEYATTNQFENSKVCQQKILDVQQIEEKRI